MPFNTPTITRRSSGRVTGDEVEYISGTPSFTLASAPVTAADGLGSLPATNPFSLRPSNCAGSGYITLKRNYPSEWNAAISAGRRVKVTMRINDSSEEVCEVQLQSIASVRAMVGQARQAQESAQRVLADLAPLIENLERLAHQIDHDRDCRD